MPRRGGVERQKARPGLTPGGPWNDGEEKGDAIGRPGSDRLSRVLRRSIMGAEAFHGRVRNGIGCGRPAKTTRSAHRIIWKLDFHKE